MRVMVDYQDNVLVVDNKIIKKMARTKERKTEMVSIRTTPGVKNFIKLNNINQTEMFEKAINKIRKKKQKELNITNLS